MLPLSLSCAINRCVDIRVIHIPYSTTDTEICINSAINAMTEAISGHSVPHSAMAMAIVATSVVLPFETVELI